MPIRAEIEKQSMNLNLDGDTCRAGMLVSGRVGLENESEPNGVAKVQPTGRISPVAHFRGRVGPRHAPRTCLHDPHSAHGRQKPSCRSRQG